MEHLTDRRSNPFGIRAPCEEAVHGYGDPNADFHLIGNHPEVHGGRQTGVPFTGSEPGKHLQQVLFELGFSATQYADDPVYDNLYASYRHCCSSPGDGPPPNGSYDRLERYFDAELRAVNAHVLLPVGTRATAEVLCRYTTRAAKLRATPPANPDFDLNTLHATEIRGRGFMIIPIADPSNWKERDRDTLLSKLSSVLASDYRQTKGVATLVG